MSVFFLERLKRSKLIARSALNPVVLEKSIGSYSFDDKDFRASFAGGASAFSQPHREAWARSWQRERRSLRAHPVCFMIERERAEDGLTMREREGECQVDIVDGDNAAEIAGEQRGLMMTLLASERIERPAGPGRKPVPPLAPVSASSIILFSFRFGLCLSPRPSAVGGVQGTAIKEPT